MQLNFAFSASCGWLRSAVDKGHGKNQLWVNPPLIPYKGVGIDRGFASQVGPKGWGFELPVCQIPTYSPTNPVLGVVGHNIDRCITQVDT